MHGFKSAILAIFHWNEIFAGVNQDQNLINFLPYTMRRNSEFYYSQTIYLGKLFVVFWGGWHFIPLYIKRKANTEAALTWKIEVVT